MGPLEKVPCIRPWTFWAGCTEHRVVFCSHFALRRFFSWRAPTGCHGEKSDGALLLHPGFPGRRRLVPRLAAAGIQDCQPLHAADTEARGSRPSRPAEHRREPGYNHYRWGTVLTRYIFWLSLKDIMSWPWPMPHCLLWLFIGISLLYALWEIGISDIETIYPIIVTISKNRCTVFIIWIPNQ